jgi:uncharacterized damage-inducible protein DinB
MSASDPMRAQLAKLLDWRESHADFDAVVADVPVKDRGVRPNGLPYSLWELLEHIRLAQRDILDFCTRDDYVEGAWPDDYWPLPPETAPPSPAAWDASIAAFRADRAALQKLAADASVDLTAKVPNGDGQTYLRELLLIADHTAYHLGQMIVLRRLLGNWQA